MNSVIQLQTKKINYDNDDDDDYETCTNINSYNTNNKNQIHKPQIVNDTTGIHMYTDCIKHIFATKNE